MIKISRRAAEHVIFDAMYEKYIARQEGNISEMRQNQNVRIPANFDYKTVRALSNEEVEKLEKTSFSWTCGMCVVDGPAVGV